MAKTDKEVAIKVEHVAKDFVLPHENSNSLKTKIIRIFNKKDKDADIQHALKNVSFEVKKGEFFGIVGRNGSGKSTLLKIISEIYKPTRGKVTINGRLVPFIELGVGFNPELTGRENVYLNGALLGFSQKEIEDMYDDIVEFAELEEFMDQRLKNYSSGMQVRLAFSVAIRAKGDILVLDEVLAVGDADFQRKCYTYFKALKNNNKTVILVTHDMNAVKEYCDRAIMINEGAVQESGSPDSIASAYLKLFNKVDTEHNEGDGDPTEETKRWGNGDVRVLSKSIDIKENSMKISFTVEAKETTADVVLGYRFYDETGAILAGASTANAVHGQRGLSFQKGDKRTLVFEGDNILGTGTYRLGYTIRLTDMVTICDDDEYAATFAHTRPEGYQPIMCPVALRVEKDISV